MSRKKLFIARSSIKIKKQFKEGNLVGGVNPMSTTWESENFKNMNETTT